MNRTTTRKTVLAHGTTELDVLYTNESEKVKQMLPRFEEWLQGEEHKFLGLDLEFTPDYRNVAVIQLCFKKNVLVFHWASSDKHCPELMNFLRSGIYFASVDISNDKIKMKNTWGIQIPTECHIDLQRLFRLGHPKTSMADMAAALIDEQYADMKKKFPKSAHKLWEKTPLDDTNLAYAAVDAYVSYELYRKIRIFNHGTRHLRATVSHESSVSSSGYYDPYDGYL